MTKEHTVALDHGGRCVRPALRLAASGRSLLALLYQYTYCIWVPCGVDPRNNPTLICTHPPRAYLHGGRTRVDGLNVVPALEGEVAYRAALRGGRMANTARRTVIGKRHPKG